VNIEFGSGPLERAATGDQQEERQVAQRIGRILGKAAGPRAGDAWNNSELMGEEGSVR